MRPRTSLRAAMISWGLAALLRNFFGGPWVCPQRRASVIASVSEAIQESSALYGVWVAVAP
jgi:hypothetical protein